MQAFAIICGIGFVVSIFMGNMSAAGWALAGAGGWLAAMSERDRADDLEAAVATRKRNA